MVWVHVSEAVNIAEVVTHKSTVADTVLRFGNSDGYREPHQSEIFHPVVVSSSSPNASPTFPGSLGSVLNNINSVDAFAAPAVFVSQLLFCDQNVINHFVCDIPPMLQLSCSDTQLTETVTSGIATVVMMSSIMVIVVTYAWIVLTIIKIPSNKGRWKTFSTIASHLTVVVIYFGAGIFMFVGPTSQHAPDQSKAAVLFYAILIPMMNPIIYSLRNKDVKEAARKLCASISILMNTSAKKSPGSMLLNAKAPAVFVSQLLFCDQNVINHFVCDIPPLLQLSCSDTQLTKVVSSGIATVVMMASFMVIVVTYARIVLTIINIPSTKGQWKTFSTCASHLIVVVIYYGAGTFMYVFPNSHHSPDQSKAAVLFYAVLTPMLNPIIYSLRNKDVKEAARKLCASISICKVFPK
ncbi:olfactory receptor 507-like [Rhinatrema bivittatum]|uniref:olfactory receptor 507-like n=1 Tax=Rhinatrema bivittatum TaxID=194408 RepID=UPI00112E4BB9|nr:olfactory receptor 507-like [Rhinatrema bivittatum]